MGTGVGGEEEYMPSHEAKHFLLVQMLYHPHRTGKAGKPAEQRSKAVVF